MSSLVLLQGRPYDNFINSLKSQETKQEYRKCLVKYLNHYKTTLESMLSLPIRETEDNLIDYIQLLRKQNLSRAYINVNFCALKHFYFMNSVVINSVKIGKFLGEDVKKNNDRGYNTTEIKCILENCDLRLKVVVFTLATTSMRIAALCELTLSSVVKMSKQGVYKFTIYKNTKQQTICFCSPECANYIDSYYEYRSRAGEHLDADPEHTPFIREQFDVNDIEQVRKHAKPANKKTIANILQSLVVNSGLRTVNHNYTNRERHETGVTKAFRKWFMHEAVESKMNPEIREMLLSHSIGLAGAYYKPSEQEMLDTYMSAVDNGFFAISEEKKWKRRAEKLEVEKTQFDRLAAQIRALEAKIK
jgi:site-specific recombinase XerD